MAKQKIKCDVENCKHNDNNDKMCELDEIKVSCDCNNNEAEKENTICKSFDCNSNENNKDE